jgi:murein DD-endopeptidase MepM/ murein hydrolase activator NlpD
MRRREAALALLLALAPGAPAAAPLDEQRLAATRTRELVAARLSEHEGGLRDRVRLLYKLSAHGDLPLWVDERARSEALKRRGAARRLIVRDLEERRALRGELQAIDADLARLDADAARARALAARPLAAGSLVRPTSGEVVAGFGPYRDPRTHVRLQRRGAELGARDPRVVAAAAGQVTFAGPLRGLGHIVVVDHGHGLVTVTTGLAAVLVSRGDLVDAGEAVGRAAGPRVGFEVRHGGRPVDPAPLLRARR